MSLDGFKKIQEDKKTTTLRHSKGHTIKIVHSQLSPQMREHIQSIPSYDEGGDVAPLEQVEVDHSQVPTMEELTAPPTAITPELATAIRNPSMAKPVNQVSEVGPKQTVQQEVPQPTGEVGDVMQGLGEMKQGLRNEAAATGRLGNEEAAILGKNQEALRSHYEQANKKFQDLDKERSLFTQDVMNGHIDPNHYIGSANTVRKVGTAIGLILGGIGAGLTGGENPAAKYIHEQINADIEAQKANLGKKENLLSANLRQFGNLKEATQMTAIQLMDMSKLELSAAAAKSNDPIAKARAQKEIGELDIKAAQLIGPLKQKQQLMQLGQSGQATPEQIIGLIPDKHEAEKAAQEWSKVKAIKEKADLALKSFDLVDEAKTAKFALQHPGRAMSGAQASQGAASIAELNKELTGRFNIEENKQLANQFLPNRIDPKEDRVLKRQQLENFAYSGVKNAAPTLSKYMNLDKFTAAPVQEQIQTMNGVKYRKVQGGWQKVGQ